MSTQGYVKEGNVSYTGTYHRRVVEYSGVWYFEWEMMSSGTLTVSVTLSGVDFYLVGGGGKGGNGQIYYTDEGSTTNYRYGGGGGSGYPLTVLNQNVCSSCTLTIGASAGDTVLQIDAITHTAVKGGNGSATSGITVHGAGYQGTYNLFDDANYPVGTASYTSTSNVGSNGCSALAPIKGTTNNALSNAYANGGSGYGAGGGGASGSALTNRGVYYGTDGAQGIALMRVPVAL